MEEAKRKAVSMLDIFECEDGRRVVHTRSGGIGADWDAEAAVEFIMGAEDLFTPSLISRALGHGIGASKGGRGVVFATKGGE